jgi:uncharacterized protein (TIGR03118 family)
MYLKTTEGINRKLYRTTVGTPANPQLEPLLPSAVVPGSLHSRSSPSLQKNKRAGVRLSGRFSDFQCSPSKDYRLLDPQSGNCCRRKVSPRVGAFMEETVMLNTSALQFGSTSADSTDAVSFVQTNLVSDLAGLDAKVTDPNLVNPWGVSFFGISPFWISDQGKDVATLYAVTGSTGTNVSQVPLVVSIPHAATPPHGPTGQVSNTNDQSFMLNGASAHFIFANLDGTISAWNGGNSATVEAMTPNAVYTGLAINSAQTMLYAANDSAGTIDVFNSSFGSVDLGHNAFKTPGQIAARGLVPFNVTDIGGDVYVTYAPAGHAAQTMAGLGDGAVAIFSESGKLEPHGVLLGGPHTPLAAPWGVAIAPNDFGQFSGDILVGNFSYLHSEINAFDPQTHKLVGTIPISTGSEKPGGLWTLTFGGGGSNGSPTTLYFTDGIDGETHGLFGAITSAPVVGASAATHSDLFV